MNAKKCDRCGEYYLPEDSYKVLNVPLSLTRGISIYDQTFGAVKLKALTFKTNRSDNTLEFDLCPSCLRKLKNWMVNYDQLEN